MLLSADAGLLSALSLSARVLQSFWKRATPCLQQSHQGPALYCVRAVLLSVPVRTTYHVARRAGLSAEADAVSKTHVCLACCVLLRTGSYRSVLSCVCAVSYVCM